MRGLELCEMAALIVAALILHKLVQHQSQEGQYEFYNLLVSFSTSTKNKNSWVFQQREITYIMKSLLWTQYLQQQFCDDAINLLAWGRSMHT
jgi:hypothetical protein